MLDMTPWVDLAIKPQHKQIMVDNLEEGRMINGAYYAEELRRLCQDIIKKRRGELT